MAKILLIEDDQILADLLVSKLQKAGYEALLARDGIDGLKQLRDIRPDLLLLDMILPGMNGYEILEERQKDPAVSGIPVIIVSNSGQPVEISRALALGVKDYVVKAQVDPDEILDKVRSTLAASHPAPQRLQGKKIVWAEDDSFLGDLLAVKFTKEGAVSHYARNGEEALEILKTEVPDVIVLDLILPGMHGFEVLKAIRADTRLAAVPVIILSNLGQKEDADRALQLGATKHLIKAEHDLDDIISEIVDTIGHSA
jgi:DNA-binding response OmpR family regulator